MKKHLMEPDGVGHLSTIETSKDADINPLILHLRLNDKLNRDGKNDSKEEITGEEGLPITPKCESSCLEEKKTETLDRKLSSDKSEEIQGVDFDKQEQVTIQTGPSLTESSINSSVCSLSSNTLSKRINRISTHRKITCERLRELKTLVDKAIKENKTFSIQGSCPSVRNALRQRGWIEKRWNEVKSPSTIPTSTKRSRKARSTNSLALIRISSSTTCSSASTIRCSDFSDTSLTNRGYHELSVEEEEDNLISRMLRNTEPALIWTSRSDVIEWNVIPKHQMVNKFPRTYFATKVGLCGYLQQMHWFYESGISDTLFPRCYCVCLPEEMQAFRDDFRLTACLSLLKWLISNYEKPKNSSDATEEMQCTEPAGADAVQSPLGKVPLSAVEFAIQRITEHIISCQHGDIDLPLSCLNNQKNSVHKTWDHQWDQFLTWFYLIVHEGKLLSNDSTKYNYEKSAVPDSANQDPLTVQDLYSKAKTCLNDVRPYWPQIDLDGMMDLWILKPGAKSRGRGIQLVNRLESVYKRLSPAVMKETRYVIQKYIERPLLIYKTKFDIRQWFLITNSYPLTIWMYKESYLRFSSQIFSLHELHESIHLCNNAVQCRYANGNDRDPALPDENMWDCYTFQTYLRTIGHGNMWEECIYPGMKESIIGALLASQDNMTDGGIAANATSAFLRGKGSVSFSNKIGNKFGSYFELFGADFMLTEDYRPWLIEINSCPCMSASTSVTARMCPQCLEDVIKVVIDRREKKESDTGMFELIYKQRVEPPPPYTGVCLSVHGKQVQKSSKNEVAASGGLEPGENPYLNVEGGLTEMQCRNESDQMNSEIICSDSEDCSNKMNLASVDSVEKIDDKEEVKDEGNKSTCIAIIEENEISVGCNAKDKPFEFIEIKQEKDNDQQIIEKPNKKSVELERMIKSYEEKYFVSSRKSNSEKENEALNVTLNNKDNNEVMNSIKLFQEWRKSLVCTRETCKGVLTQLKLFREWHMQSREEFRERSAQAIESVSKTKLSDKVPFKNKLRWKKVLHKNSIDLHNSSYIDKNYSKCSKSKNVMMPRENLSKRMNSGANSKFCQENHKKVPVLPKFRQEIRFKAKKSNLLDKDCLDTDENEKKYFNPISNVNAKGFESFTKNPEDGASSHSEVFLRQKSFLDHITVLNRKHECHNCLVTSNYDEIKKKAGFRPIEVVTFDPPFL